MKDLFPGHFHPPANFQEALNEALIVFDTNVLINFYEWGPTTRRNQFDTLLKVQDRCWIPFHVALEFHRNRIGRVEHALKNHQDVIKRVNSDIASIVTNITARDVFTKNPETAAFLTALQEAGEALTNHANVAIKEFPRTSNEDPVNDFLAELFKGRVGQNPSQETIEEINKQGKRRYESKHPPGVTDANKEGQKYMDRDVMYSGMYGDLYIWMQILAFIPTVADKKHLIFVTDERKADWWAKSEIDQLTPAPELAQELAIKAPGWRLWMYPSPDFFRLLTAALGAELSPADLAEITEASVSGLQENKPDNLIVNSAQDHYSFDMLVSAYVQWVADRHNLQPSEVSYLYSDDEIDILTHGAPPYQYHIKVLNSKKSLAPFELMNYLENSERHIQKGHLPALILDTSSLKGEQKARVLQSISINKIWAGKLSRGYLTVHVASIDRDGKVRSHEIL